MNRIVRLGKGLLMILTASLIGWRILATGFADYYAQKENPEEAIGALSWQEQHPEALYQQALQQQETDPATAERLLQTAAWANPTDARVYIALAELWAAAGRQPAAVKLAELADILGPVNSLVLAQSADFWQSQGRPDRMLPHWSQLLLARRTTVASVFYPELLSLAEDPNQQALLLPLLKNPPTWWSSFFVYAAREAQHTDTVVFLYQNRQREAPPSSDHKNKKDLKEEQDEKNQQNEQDAYLNRLWQNARWTEAHTAWLNGLDERQRKELSNLYNGGFELPISNVGFDWTITTARGATIETVPTYGIHGERALHVVFDGQRVRFQHIFQYLMLEPGQYQLQGRTRPDNLRTTRGLRWRMYCIPFGKPDESSLLAESNRFLGSDEWRLFTVDFTVPTKNCAAQLLRLELEGRATLDFEIQGGIWFDDLAIIQPE